MSTGSASIPLLKAAPEPDQVAERLDGGAVARASSSCLMPPATSPTTRRSSAAIDVVRRAVDAAGDDVALTAEAPVRGRAARFVRVDRLDDEARAGIERSARFAAAIGSPVLTIHLFIPQTPEEFRARRAGRRGRRSRRSCASSREACARARRHAADRERPARAAHAHGRRLPARRSAGTGATCCAWRERVPDARLHARHLARRAVPHVRRRVPVAVRAWPATRGSSSSATSRSSGRRREVAHVSNARGRARRGPALRRRGELDLDPVVARLGELVPYVVAEINEPDHARLAVHEGRLPARRARAARARRARGARRRAGCRAERVRLAGASSAGATPCPPCSSSRSALAGAARARHRRRRLDRPRAHDAARRRSGPELITVLDAHEAALTADRRARGAARLAPLRARAVRRARPRRGWRRRSRARAPGRRLPPRRLQARRLGRALPGGVRGDEPRRLWNVLRAAEAAGARHRRRRLDRQGRAGRDRSTGARSG